MLGLPLDKVKVKIGDSDLPPAPVEGGSWTAASVGSAVMEACDGIRKELLSRAGKLKNTPLDGAELADVTFVDGEIRMKGDLPAACPCPKCCAGLTSPSRRN